MGYNSVADVSIIIHLAVFVCQIREITRNSDKIIWPYSCSGSSEVIDLRVSWKLLCDFLYDTIEEFNVDSKAEYSSALSSTRSQKNIKKEETKTNASAPLVSNSNFDRICYRFRDTDA